MPTASAHAAGSGAGRSPLIGRERECDVLRRAVARADAGESVFVLVVGDPGIGKTTLLTVASSLAQEVGLAVGCGRGVVEGAAPLCPWTSALRTIDSGRSRIADVLVDPADAGPSETAAMLDAGAERFAVFERLALALSSRARDGPLALVVDDLQWADISTLRLFRHLLDVPSLGGVLVVGGLRTTEPLATDMVEAVSGLLAHPSVEVVEVPAF